MKKEWPEYADEKTYQGLEDGLYLGLYHGFKDDEARQAKDDWGDNGPVIGPLQYFHTTYACDFKYGFKDARDAEKYGIPFEGHFTINGDCLVFDGMEYGDWTVFQIKDGKTAQGKEYCHTCKPKSGQTVYSEYWGGDAPCPTCAPTNIEFGYGIEEDGGYRTIGHGYATKEEAIKAREDNGVEGASILRIEVLND